MEYRYLGSTGLKVSAFCMGTMTFGERWKDSLGGFGEEQAQQIVDRCLDAGINFFDTANVYSFGESEELLGRVLGARRKDAVVALADGKIVRRLAQVAFKKKTTQGRPFGERREDRK